MNDTTKSIKKLFNEFKLGNSLITARYSLNKETILTGNIPEKEIINIIDKNIITEFANEVSRSHPSAIKEVESDMPDIRIRELKMLVLSIDDFKSIVEGVIQLLPEKELTKIRNYEI